LWYVDASVVGVPLAATSRDLSDIAIDDDYSMLDEFLESTTQTSSKFDQCSGLVLLPNPVQLSADKFAFVVSITLCFVNNLLFYYAAILFTINYSRLVNSRKTSC